MKRNQPASPKKNRRAYAKFGAIALLVLGVIVISTLFFTFGPASGNTLKNDSHGFPVSVNGAAVVQAELAGSDIVLLSDSALTLYNARGIKRTEVNVEYASPAMAISGGKIVVYEHEGSRLMLCDKSGMASSAEIGHDILTCSVAKNGNTAVASLADDSASRLTVYDSSLTREIFVWRSSAYIVRTAISPNGRYAAAAVLGVEGGDIYAEVFVFDTKQSEPLSSFRYVGTTVIGLMFSGNSDLTVYGDNLVSHIAGRTEKGEDTVFQYGAIQLMAVDSSGVSAMVVSQAGNTAYNLLFYDKTGRELFRKQLTAKPLAVDCDSGSVSVLFGDKTEKYRSDGSQVSTLQTANDSLRVLVKGQNTYVLAMSELRQYNDTEDSTQS